MAQAEIGRLEELHLVAVEERIEADIALGRHADVVPELESLVVAHPLRERLRGLLMLALYRCDRQSDALETYRTARATLVEELGIEPSKALQRLEQAILTQDPELDALPPPAAAPRPPAAAHAPSGTVTFLSIGVDDSREAFDELSGVVRDVAGERSGHEVETHGDAFLLAFASARDAVAAALSIRRPPRVQARIAVHSGEPGVGTDGYHGIDVVRVSRICASAHAGQILLSSAAKELAEGDLPAGAELHDLGSYLLKGVDRPERIYQLDADGERHEFPPASRRLERTADCAAAAAPARRAGSTRRHWRQAPCCSPAASEQASTGSRRDLRAPRWSPCRTRSP